MKSLFTILSLVLLSTNAFAHECVGSQELRCQLSMDLELADRIATKLANKITEKPTFRGIFIKEREFQNYLPGHFIFSLASVP